MLPQESIPWTTGVDYITATVREKCHRERFGSLALALLQDERSSGSEAKPWSGKGYQGLRCGSVQYGTRPEDDLVRISGGLADSTWEAFYGYAHSIPRVDFQVTIWDSQPVLPRLRVIDAWADSRPGGRKAKPIFGFRKDTLGGGTLYCGRRQSEFMGRIYDCGAKHRGPEFEGSIRLEVQAMGRRGWQLCAALKDKILDHTQRAAWVLGWFEARIDSSKTDSIIPTLRQLATATDQAVILPSLPRVAVGCQRSLEIAAKQWGPTARRLVQAGMGQQLLDSLGLSVSACGDLVVCNQVKRR